LASYSASPTVSAFNCPPVICVYKPHPVLDTDARGKHGAVLTESEDVDCWQLGATGWVGGLLQLSS
jgi:hypothetical protein